MEITETVNEGLKRLLTIVIPKDEMIAKRNERLSDLKDKVRINGFRPGKAPIDHIANLYGKSVMAELVNETVEKEAGKILADRNEKSAQKPKIAMTEDEKEAETILKGEQDFQFTIEYEVVPEFKTIDFGSLEIKRQVVPVSKEDVKEQIELLAKSNVSYEEKKGKAEEKDRVTFDYAGTIDGEAFDGGKDTNAQLVLGSNTFIPGFEAKMIGKQAGDEDRLDVPFPKDYPAEHLAGKKAVFEVLVHKVEKPVKAKMDDEFAKGLGVENFARLEEMMESRIKAQYDSRSREKCKRRLLDLLDEKHSFELPKETVESEFESVWRQVTDGLEQHKKTFKDEGTTEEKARKDYRKLAERRVRLGLILAKVGAENKIEVAPEELQKALYEQAAQYPGQEKEVFEFLKSNPERMESVRAPLFEEKVVNFILEKVKMKEEKTTKAELMKEDG